ncbi:MAG: 2,3-diketo-5-methylthio-phosphopentanephosphatase [Verrucomicrobiaceae bacterium]|nr:2,3-diketo-5-methylthio-phosphopentanephosphatase [Verrucomicrobiaceae bacterium]
MIHFDGGLILLDVEGTVSPLAFVHEVMFPFARRQVAAFVEEHWAVPEVTAALEQMAADAGHASLVQWYPFRLPSPEGFRWLEAQVHQWMDADAKLTGLKQLQGLVWEQGFKSGALCATLFDEVARVLRDWHASGLQLRIYSSGSVRAQKMFFSHTRSGDLTPLLKGYYDTTTGPKRDAASYRAIAAHAGFAPQDVLFLSDVTAELDAAHSAGMQTGLAIRPGNRETESVQHPLFHSLHDIITVCP